MPNVRDHDASVYLRLQGDALSVGGYEPNPIFWDEVTIISFCPLFIPPHFPRLNQTDRELLQAKVGAWPCPPSPAHLGATAAVKP